MKTEQDLAGLAERAVAVAVRHGAGKCDAVACETRSITSELERGSVKQASIATDPGVGIRVFDKGSPGFAYCTSFDEAAVAKAAQMAVSLAKAGTEDSDFKDLPDKSVVRRASGLYEQRVADLEPDEVVSMTIDMADRAGDDKRITSVNASAGVAICHIALANSNGFCGAQKLTSIDMMVESVAREGDAMFSGFDGSSRRRLESDLLDRIANTARDQAIKGLVQTKLETGDYPVIFAPFSVGYVLGEAIGDGANADSVQRGRSYLAGRLGQSIGVSSLNVLDDPTVEWGVRSTAFDGEGVPSRAKSVIENGKLVSYLHDSYTAGKASEESTGNSSRGGAVWSYRHPPGISASNLVISPGDHGLEEMIEETKLGVYLRATFDSPNLATGEFSGLMMESYLIEDGALGPSIRQATVGIDIVTLLSKIDMLGKKPEKYFGVVAPPIRISSARIAGSG
jgi:PmbA protein